MNYNHYEVELRNGKRYKVIPSNNASRGNKYNQIFIEIGTEQVFVDTIVMPSLIASDILEEDMIIYYNSCKDGYRFFIPVGGCEFYTRIGLMQ